jgi:hypothetical protein
VSWSLSRCSGWRWIEAVIKDNAEVLAMWREEMKGEPGRPKTGDNVTPIERPDKGNSKAYTLSRLKRENAELFNQVVAGELSANAASHRSKSNVHIVTSVTVKRGRMPVKSRLERLT